MLISAEKATAVAIQALTNVGVPEDPARPRSSLVVEAEARGLPSHGLLRLPLLVERIRNGVAESDVLGDHRWAGQALLLVDGRNGLGPVVARAALGEIRARTQDRRRVRRDLGKQPSRCARLVRPRRRGFRRDLSGAHDE